MMPGGFAGAYIATQIDVIRSERVTKRFIDALRLRESAQLRQQWRKRLQVEAYSTPGSPNCCKEARCDAIGDSTVITIAYTAVDPAFASAMANAFIQAYLDTALSSCASNLPSGSLPCLRSSRAGQGNAWKRLKPVWTITNATLASSSQMSVWTSKMPAWLSFRLSW